MGQMVYIHAHILTHQENIFNEFICRVDKARDMLQDAYIITSKTQKQRKLWPPWIQYAYTYALHAYGT